MYNSGKQKRTEIIESSKKLFYDNGIADTNIATIMRLAEINRSSFFYYFKDIFDIATVVYGQMLSKHFLSISEIFKPYELNDLEKTCLIGASHMRLVLSDKNVSRFTSQIIFHNIIEYDDTKRSVLENTAIRYIPKEKMISGEYFAIQSMALSAHLYKKNANETLSQPTDKLVSFKLESFLRNLFLSDDECKRLKSKILSIEKEICFETTPYFNVELVDR